MKKIILFAIFISLTTFFLIGCLKDKDFENHKFGLTDPGNQPPGIGFPEASVALNSSALNFVDTPQTINFPLINLDAKDPAPSDIHVTLIQNPSLITDYNTNNPSAGLIPLPTSAYTIPSLKLTIKQGTRNVTLKITIPNAKTLDLTKTYALAFTISSVDETGYIIPSNYKNVILAVAIKNIYDGVYSIKGSALRAGDAVLSGPTGPFERSFVTAGATAVQWQGGVPWANGSGSQLPAGYEPKLTIDPVTNMITSITSASGISATSTYNQRYDPATKTFYFQFTYGGGPSSRLFTDTAKYVRPR